MVDELSVRLRGEHVGALVHFDDDRMMFVPDSAYAERLDRPVLSLSFADTDGGFRDEGRRTTRRAPPYFSNLLPEGHLRSYLAAQAGVNESRDYPLLVLTGRDLPGAVELVADSSAESMGAAGSGVGTGDEGGTNLRFSLAGVQLKFSAVMEATAGLTLPAQGRGGDWIVKLPSAAYEGVPENEYSIMRIASLIGIETPQVELVSVERIAGLPDDVLSAAIGDKRALAVRRFDRAAGGERIHTEDFAQVFGMYPERKYERYGYVAVGRVLASFAGDAAVDQFARRLIYGALVGNADLHLKNWSLIYLDGRTPALAPAYDLLSTVSYLPDSGMALRLVRGARQWEELTMDRFAALADRMGVGRYDVLGPVAETVERFREVWTEEARHLPVAQRVADAVARQLETVPAARAPHASVR